MNGVPPYVRVLGWMAGVLSLLLLLSVMATGAVTANSVTASGENARTFSVGNQPTVELNTTVGMVEVRSGPAGRVDVDERWSASSLTRAAAESELRAIQGEMRQRGDLVQVRLNGLRLAPWTFNRSSSVRVTIPEGTTLRVTADAAEVRLSGLLGTVQVIDRGGAVEVQSSRLTGESQLHNRFGELRLDSVTVAGHTSLSSEFGRVAFSGSLAPGGSTLDVHDGEGAVEVMLPQPTDARARVAVQSGSFSADPAWGFQVVSAGGAKTAVADLGASPTGSVFVTMGAGEVSFGLISENAKPVRPAL
ncbi:MAG: hypothetical protein DLM67_17310 [Candidatus Nephthysia bennettiae]|uniref:Adhesin domain-containing protein n=1 Tax=Candidatus Nephthysia bennettiae TaxID=3127016 RepID=A0A934NA28_9BACT|nr:hypothetical protein [Candidatus Dormibacteraeota bacterium]MBJ7611186.1 hypothetical protein [Candidatus Dormibacteraeota bacterium]PZR90611.1 MAG: hypothetical protein DLM67_17310 [Candidatus Dormibacteraeota bacterium]